MYQIVRIIQIRYPIIIIWIIEIVLFYSLSLSSLSPYFIIVPFPVCRWLSTYIKTLYHLSLCLAFVFLFTNKYDTIPMFIIGNFSVRLFFLIEMMFALFFKKKRRLLPINNPKLDENVHTNRNIMFFFILIYIYINICVCVSVCGRMSEIFLPHKREKLYMKNERNDNKPLCSMSHITLNSDLIHQSNQTVRAIAFIGTAPCCFMLLHVTLHTPSSMLPNQIRWFDTNVKFTFILFYIDGAKNGRCAPFHSQYMR